MKKIVGPDFEDPRWDYSVSPFVQSEWARPRRMRPMTLKVVMDALTAVFILVVIISTSGYLLFGRSHGTILEFLISPWYSTVMVLIAVLFFRTTVDSLREVDPLRKYKPGWKEPAELEQLPRAPMTMKLSIEAFGRLLFVVFLLYVGGFLVARNWFEEPLNYFTSPQTLIPLAVISLWYYFSDVDAQRKLQAKRAEAKGPKE